MAYIVTAYIAMAYIAMAGHSYGRIMIHWLSFVVIHSCHSFSIVKFIIIVHDYHYSSLLSVSLLDVLDDDDDDDDDDEDLLLVLVLVLVLVLLMMIIIPL